MRNKSIFSTSSSPEWTGTVNSDKKMASALDIHRGRSESVSVPILRATEVGERWPILLWFYLKTLGLYHSGFLVCSKLCNRCAKSKTHTAFYYTDNQCKVCDSLTWDYKGVPTVVTDNEIGSSFLNHCGSGFLSMMWLLLITGITLANIVLLIASYANSGCDIVHVLAWIGMKLLLYIGPFICFVSVVHATWPSVFMGSWSNTLAVEFLVHRMRFVNMKDKQFAGYVLFLGSVVVMGTQCLKITAPYFDPELVSPMVANETLSSLTTLVPLHFFVIVEGYINFGGFCYIVYLLRCSYESEIKLVTKFLGENIDNIDLCRARLAEAFDAYHIFREFSSGWIALNLILCTVCLFLELHVWIVKTDPLSFFQYVHSFLLLFFLMLPIISLGNVDVDYLWNRLVRQVSRQRKTEQEDSWDKIMQFLQEQRAGARPWQAVLAFFLSTIAVFSAIQFRLWSNNQNIVNVYTMTNGSLSLMQQSHYS